MPDSSGRRTMATVPTLPRDSSELAGRRGPGADLVGRFRLFMLLLDTPERTHAGFLHVLAARRGSGECRLTLVPDGAGELVLLGQALIVERACQFLFPAPAGLLCSIVAELPAPPAPIHCLQGTVLLSGAPPAQGMSSGQCLLQRIGAVPFRPASTAHARDERSRDRPDRTCPRRGPHRLSALGL